MLLPTNDPRAIIEVDDDDDGVLVTPPIRVNAATSLLTRTDSNAVPDRNNFSEDDNLIVLVVYCIP